MVGNALPNKYTWQEIFGQQKEQIMKQIHILFILELILVFSSCHNNPTFNGEELKSLLKEKTGIVIEDSLAITNFEWSAAIGGDYYEAYTLKSSLRDYKNILNYASQNGWEDLGKGYLLAIPPISFRDTAFAFSVYKDKPEIRISIVKD
jgi:hypothetical protein